MTTPNKLATSIEYLKGVGPQRADLLKQELHIFTFGDLLQHFPFRYVDKSLISKVQDLLPETPYIQLKGKISHLETVGGGRGKRLVAQFKDETGMVELIWFKGIKWVKEGLLPNREYLLYGRPNFYRGRFNIPHPELELVDPNKKQVGIPLEPVYNTTEKLKTKGLDSKGLRKLMVALVQQITPTDITENLPTEMLDALSLMDRFQAFRTIHFPQTETHARNARARLKFEELFFIQLGLLKVKSNREQAIKGFVFEQLGEYFNNFYDNHLAFELTNAQKRVLKEIRKDVLAGKQMNRLLQGDVGSGKTIVALMSMLMAIDNDFQAALMVPTEILAQQHYTSITEISKGLGLRTALLTGSVKGKSRKQLLQLLQEGHIHILIGTHALIEDPVMFRNLGLVVIDEQHRFGVAQRAKLWRKNTQPPHILVMTATPIPRTLAMTLYGDLDVSVIDELPPGRKPVKTVHRTDAHRIRVFGFMKEQIKLGRQVYVVYPLIRESEKMDYKDLMDGYESIMREFPRPKYQVSIVHGQMKSDDKDAEMQRFVKGETDIMVATTVIEVGVNVPNASVMVIESSERFGLSQLHQLRGRVGRGADQSYCILMTGVKLSKEGKQRINTMVRTNDGFDIAEEDLRMRGPGDIEGTQQSGLLQLKIADLAKDQRILTVARDMAAKVLDADPELAMPQHQKLKLYLEKKRRNQFNWSMIS